MQVLFDLSSKGLLRKKWTVKCGECKKTVTDHSQKEALDFIEKHIDKYHKPFNHLIRYYDPDCFCDNCRGMRNVIHLINELAAMDIDMDHFNPEVKM